MRRRFLWSLAPVALVLGCQETGAPDRGRGPVLLQLRLENVLSGETLRILPHYRRTNESIVQLEPRQVALEDAASQTVPIEIDISDCLTDAAREGEGAGCPLRVALVLRNALGELLDSVLVGPLDAVAGASVSPPAVTLRHPNTILLTAPADSVVVGGTLVVSAQVLDRVSVPVTNPKLTWSSSNPAVATISSSGVVTGVTPGAFTVTAILEGRPTGPVGTLPLDVRGGAPIVIGPAGGTVYSRDGQATLVIPAGALTAPTPIQIEPEDGLENNRAVPGTAFRFTPDGLAFQQPAMLTLRYSTASVPDGAANEPTLRMFLVIEGGAVRVAGSVLSISAHTVTAPINSFSVYTLGIAMVGVRSLTMADDHTCAVLASGSALCFGNNAFGGLGDGTTVPGIARLVSGGHNFSTVSAGAGFTCGLTTGGQVYCWGQNNQGQLGIGSTTNSLVPQLVALPAPAVSVSAGGNSACATDQNRVLYCWGRNSVGQLGAAAADTCSGFPCSLTPIALPSAAPSGTRAISSGLQHRCEISSLQVACWGWNVHAQLGLPVNSPPQSQSPVPQLTGITQPFTALLAGNVLTCGLQGNGAAYCWGSDFFGSRGSGTTSAPISTAPVLVAGGLQLAHLSPARANIIFAASCGVTVAGDGYCWGANTRGGLGTTAAMATCTFGTFPPFGCTGTPVPLEGGLKFREIHTGTEAACGWTVSDEVWCWGANNFGPDILTPLRIP